MRSDETEELLTEIGHILSEDEEYPLNGTLLYAKVARAWVEMSIFKDLGDRVLFRIGSHELALTLLDLWGVSPPDERWVTIEYFIQDGRFKAKFAYVEDVDLKEDQFVRRDRVLKRYYGDKPVEYSGLDEEGDGVDFEL